MVLNWIWISFFLIAFLMAAGRSLFGGDLQVWSDIMNASFDQAAFAFEISLGLTGVLTLWLGIMKIGEKAGVDVKYAFADGKGNLEDVFGKLFLEVSVTYGTICICIAEMCHHIGGGHEFKECEKILDGFAHL